jgi:hypothetical protein
MLHKAFTSTAALAVIMSLGSTALAGAFGSVSPQRQHHWVDANAAAASVLSVHPGYGFSASERPEYAGGAGQHAPAAGAAPAVVGQGSGQGAIAITARQHQGAEAIDVTGTAPPGTAIEITTSAEISMEIPVVFLNTATAVSDSSGAFSVTIPIAPDYILGTEILILAQAPGTQPGTASFIVGEPSNGPPIQSTDVDNGN